MIDCDGFRANVGIVLVNGQGAVFWGKRLGNQNAWQFPQGGINSGESAEQACYRELQEEVGLTRDDVELLDVTRGWLRYRLPQRFVRHQHGDRRAQEPVCIGQKQKWFLLHVDAELAQNKIDLNSQGSPEFAKWIWASYWHPLNGIVNFKREVYRKALKELSTAHNRLLCRTFDCDDREFHTSRYVSGLKDQGYREVIVSEYESSTDAR